MPSRIDLFPVKEGMEPQALASGPRGVIEHLDLDPPGHEALHIVDVEALVDPGDEQALETVPVGADLPLLPLLHAAGLHDQGEDAQRRLHEGLGGGQRRVR